VADQYRKLPLNNSVRRFNLSFMSNCAIRQLGAIEFDSSNSLHFYCQPSVAYPTDTLQMTDTEAGQLLLQLIWQFTLSVNFSRMK